MKNQGTSPSGQIIVLGMHRSGTSCIGNLLTKLGVYFGDPSVSTGSSEQNRKGFFERRDLREICDAILQGAGRDWWAVKDFSPDQVPPHVQAEVHEKFDRLVQDLDQNRPWFIKEPRLCLVWPVLSGRVPNPVFLHVWRNPIEVARSLTTRNGFPMDFGVALWETYVRSAHAVSRGRPSVIVPYNELLKDPISTTSRLVAELQALGVTGISMPDESQIRDAVDADLYREQQATPELDELIGSAQQKIVDALAQRNLNDPALFQPVSALSRVRIDDWSRREGAIIASRNDATELKRARRELRKLRDVLDERDRLIAALKDQIHSANIYLDHLRARVGAFRAKASQALNQALEEIRAVGNTGVSRASVLWQLERASRLNVLARGIRAVPAADRDAAPNRRALYWHYTLHHRRKDAGALAQMGASGWFDPHYYAQNIGGALRPGVDPLIHYVDVGASKGRNPSALFDTAYYLKQNRDVADSGINPLLHFVRHGHKEGREPRPSRALELSQVAKALLDDFIVLPVTEFRPDAGLSKSLPQRLVVYTAISGGYDDLQPPGITPPGCDFVVFSDQPLEVKGWQVRPFNYFSYDPTRNARFVKTHPHVYFPDYDHSIWIDANIGIRGDLRRFFNALTDESPVAIFNHPLRDSIYAEAAECIKRNKDDPNAINRHVERYRAEGFPEKSDLWETNIVVRRHNDPACMALMNAWWREIETGSRRDQLSLPVVTQRLGAKIAPLGLPGEDARNHPLVTLSKHPAERKAGDGRLPAAPRRKVDIDAMPIDIGICVHNSERETKVCIESLLNSRRPQDRLIVVDDASDAPTATLLDQFVKDRGGIELVRHDQNRGYTRSANAVLKNAKSPWVLLLNSDTIVPANAIPKLVTCGEQFPALAVMGPLSNAAGWQTVPQLTGSDGKFLVNSLPESLTVEDMDRLCEELSDGVVPFVPLVNGFCFAMRRSAIDQIGLFDEKNFPIGYGEEDDFCLRAGAAGFLCGLATDSYVFHSKSASFTPARRAPLVEKGGKALRMKHSTERVAAAVETMKRHPYLALVRQRIEEALHKRLPRQETA